MAKRIFSLLALIAIVASAVFSFAFVPKAAAWGIVSMRLGNGQFNGCSWEQEIIVRVEIDPWTYISSVDAIGNSDKESPMVKMHAKTERSKTYLLNQKDNGTWIVVTFTAIKNSEEKLGEESLTVQIPENPACAPSPVPTNPPTKTPNPTPSASPTPSPSPIPPATTPVTPTQPIPPTATPTSVPTPVGQPPVNQPPSTGQGHSGWNWMEKSWCEANTSNDPNYNPLDHSFYEFKVTSLSNFPLNYLSDSGRNVVHDNSIVVTFTDALVWPNGVGIRIFGVGYHPDGSKVERSRSEAWIIPDVSTAEGRNWYQKQGCWYTPPVVKNITSCVQYFDGHVGHETYPEGGSPTNGNPVEESVCSETKDTTPPCKWTKPAVDAIQSAHPGDTVIWNKATDVVTFNGTTVPTCGLPNTSGEFDPADEPWLVGTPWGGMDRVIWELEFA